jgi:hypothetical protein
MWSNKVGKGGPSVKIIVYPVILILFALTSVPVFGEEAVDGTKPLICATLQAVSCSPGEECEQNLPESIGAPQFLWIDFSKKEIISSKRSNRILFMDKNDEQITMQGFELGMGWTLVIDRATGKAILTFANREEGIVIFGGCTAQ